MREATILTRPCSRRQALQLAGAGALTGAAFFWSPRAFSRSGPWGRHSAIMDLLAGAEPMEGGITLELPSVSEDGSNVPLTVSVDSPMEDDDYVESIYLFAPGNPNEEVAAFHLTPLAGDAWISTRIRLNESQRVFALARLSNGDFRVAHQEARVTVSGCLADDATYDTDNIMQTRVRIPSSLGAGEAGEVLTLINHPMETGFRERGDGEIIPRHIIDSFLVEFDGEPALRADIHPSLAANPYLRFRVKPRRSTTMRLTWTDDQGATAEEEAEITVG